MGDSPSSNNNSNNDSNNNNNNHNEEDSNNDATIQNNNNNLSNDDEKKLQTHQNLRSVGWYWGSISPDYASKVLELEHEGSFLVRDSSSQYYLFSISFKFEGTTHHCRIEHSKGYYTFGRSPKFRCKSIVGFIEQVIEYSKNGNFSFFLHRDPSSEGPVRLRLKPVSRHKVIGSLKHMCRFAILPYVKRDRLSELCLPESLTEYLSEPF